MKTYQCQCGNRLFFDNTVCTACETACGWCEACHGIHSLLPANSGLRCGNPSCGVSVAQCDNYSTNEICNRYLPAKSAPEKDRLLCTSCRLTSDIPDLTNEGNLARWQALEAAKRRLLVELDELGLRYIHSDPNIPSVSFRFLADTPTEPVTTGHQDGVITINLKEADPVKREQARQDFDEPQRTLIGHFRHEIAHYYWQVLVQGHHENECLELFGDHQSPSYAEAMSRYYQSGPPANWAYDYISRYAASHPWEDFAETFAFYLDLRSVLDTVNHHLPRQATHATYDFPQMLADYQRLGMIFNEINRTMGLTDLLPEVIAPRVANKIHWIHDLTSGQLANQSPATA